jgi:branched-chain amino acid aminotransferase
MTDNIGDLYIINDIVESSNKIEDIESSHENVVYEVIRTIDSVPLFFDEHYSRLKKSLGLLKIELDITKQKFKKSIQKLIEVNGEGNCNIRLLVYKEAENLNFQMYICKSYYPIREEIESGINVTTFKLKRDNPNIKLVNPEYKAQIAEIMKETGVYEVLLVNNEDKITEGSKSNTFFIKGTKVFTAPGEYVLKGITRKYIIDICNKLGFELVETLISLDILKDMDGLFISGTSNKVLPVAKVDNMIFNSASNATIIAIRDQYDRLIEGYVKEHTKK